MVITWESRSGSVSDMVLGDRWYTPRGSLKSVVRNVSQRRGQAEGTEEAWCKPRGQRQREAISRPGPAGQGEGTVLLEPPDSVTVEERQKQWPQNDRAWWGINKLPPLLLPSLPLLMPPTA